MDPETTTRPRSRGRAWLAAAIVLVVLIVATVWVLNPPGLIRVGSYSSPVTVGEQHLGFGVYPEDGRRIQLRSVEPVLAPDSAAAEIDLAVCRAPRLMAVGGFDQHCAEVYDVQGATINGEDLQLVVGVTPLEPGTVRIVAFDVSYRDGVRFGSGRVATEIVIEGKPSR